jgi:hypothetical protein
LILLTATTDKLSLITSGTQALSVHVSYVDVNGAVVTPDKKNTAISTATTTDITGSPGVSTQRNIKHISIRNKDAAASSTITVQFDQNGTLFELEKITLLAGYSYTYNDLDGWVLMDSSGGRVQSPLAGRWLKRTVILNGTTTFTTGPSTNSIIARMCAGGGGGGGAPAVSGEHGSGGGSGSYAEWAVAVTPNTAYTVAVGAGGTGVSGANGNTGGITTFQVGATTVTCNAGVGGIVGNSATVPRLGGAGGAISTNGTINIAGAPGEPGVMSATTGYGGRGGDCILGAGGAPTLFANAVGAAAPLYGGGGGGAATLGTAELGGAGANGVIIVDEYS